MDLSIAATDVQISRENYHDEIRLEIGNASNSEILDHFKIADVVEHFTIQEILGYIGIKEAKQYWDLTEIND